MTNKERLNKEYLERYNNAMDALEAIKNRIHDMPAPESEGLNWGDFGDMARIAAHLEELLSND